MDERDEEILVQTLFDIRSRVVDIHDALFLDEEDDDAGTQEEDDT